MLRCTARDKIGSTVADSDECNYGADELGEEGNSMSEFDARQYWDKRLKQVWNLQGVGMRGLSRNYNRWLYRVRRAVFRRTVRGLPYPLNECDVLDVGSGTGFYINLWRRLGARRVTGVDIADSAVQQLSEKYPDVRFQQADIGAEKPFDNESFDIVSA